MATNAWNGVVSRPAMPATAADTTNGASFAVPSGATVMTVHVPTLAGGATLKIQSLIPAETVESTETWRDLTVFDPTDGSYEAVDGLVSATTAVFAMAYLGGGMLRFVATATQAASPVTVIVFFQTGG